jgi:conjugation system TraG family ATPase
VVNWYCVKEPLKDIHGALDTKRRQMQSMSLRSAENRKYAEEINDYLEKAATEQMYTVRCHLNVLSADTGHAVEAAISKLGIVPVRDIANAPAQFWAGIPGNESGLAFSEYMTLEMNAALCLCIWDGLEGGMEGGVLKMSDRIRLVPQRFDIQELAMELGLIENYNVFLLGPSGSGKSFFMNKYLRACYMAGEMVFLIDQGDSYRGLCHIIREESGGKDGSYYTFEKGKPISFNPFRNVGRFRLDAQALDFLYTLMCLLWRNGEAVSSAELKFIKGSVDAFLESLRQAQGDKDPVFNDYYEFVRDVYAQTLEQEGIEKEYFDLKSYLLTLEQFYKDGSYGYLLNSPARIDILSDRFVVFEIDAIKDDKIVYPITTLVIMDAFSEKMRSTTGFKVMVIEEAWKAMMGSQMATYMLELWKTARKHRTSAVVVTQELKDITSSPIIKDSIVENSGVKILLDQTKYLNRFEELAAALSLSEEDKGMVLSLNRMPGHAGHDAGREVFFNLGNKKSFVMRLEVSPEERLAFSSAKKDKLRLAAAVEKCGGSYIKAIKKLLK